MSRLFHLSIFGIVSVSIFVFLVYVTIFVTSKIYIYDTVTDVPIAEVALVPGAALTKDGGLSSVFTARVDVAIELYKAKKVSKILVSGDNSTLSHNEVNPARVYLINKGILDQDIFLDHAGFDTYSSMYRARDVFGVSSIIISTQSFHLPRAVFIARQLGIEAYGVRADISNLRSSNYFREIFANEKAILDLLFQRTPKFLGDEIPITGDGRNYP
jgi:SanA protein